MRITGRETVWDGNHLRFVRLSYEGADGGSYDWEAYERPNVKGIVAIVPVTAEGEVVLIRQFRPPVGAKVWEVPAGLMDGEESPEDCAVRELLEETGYRAANLTALVKGPASPATSRSILNVFLATGLTWEGRSGGDPNEDIEVRLVPLASAVQELTNVAGRGELVDLKVFGLIELARRAFDGEGG